MRVVLLRPIIAIVILSNTSNNSNSNYSGGSSGGGGGGGWNNRFNYGLEMLFILPDLVIAITSFITAFVTK